MTPLCGEEITSIKPRLKRLFFFCIFSFGGLFVLLCVPPFTIDVSCTYELFMLKVRLNTNQP